MKKSTILMFLVLFVTINMNAQTLKWAKKMGGNIGENSRSIAVDALGNVYTTGNFQGTVDFDPGPGTFNLNTYGFSIFISKLDSSGNFIWAKRIGLTGTNTSKSITLDAFGNVYITGWFEGTVDFDPGIGTYYMTPNGLADIYISKFDSAGNFIWAKQMGGANYANGLSIALDLLGNIYTMGCFNGTSDFDPGVGIYNLTPVGNYDIFISKLDSSGNFIWAKSMGGINYDEGCSFVIDGSGNVYTTGRFEGTADFDPGPGIYNLTSFSTLFTDIFISKLDSLGNFVWAKQMGGTDYDIGYSIALDALGNVYTTGSFEGTADFNPGVDTVNLTSTSAGYNTFITKLDSAGNFIWAKQVGGNLSCIGNTITIDTLGNVYTSGSFSGSSDFDPGIGVHELNSVGIVGATDIFISKLDSSGNFIWAKRMGGTMNDFGSAIYLNSSGTVYLTGNFGGTADFNPGPGLNCLTSNGYSDIFIIKLLQNGITGFVYNDINHNCVRDSNELGLNNRLITIFPGDYITQTNESGDWVVDSLPVGNYTIRVDTSGNWQATCPVVQTFIVTNPNEITYAPDFGLASTQPCAGPEVSINMPFMRPCFSNQLVHVSACNQNIATGVLNNAYVDVELDSLIIPQSASIAYTSLGNSTYRFQLGTLNTGQCVSFTINCNVSCNAALGQTICIQANIYPADTCVFDTIPTYFPGNFTPCTLPWDRSSLNVEGYCQNDSIFFVVTNTGVLGNGDMDCFSPVRIYIDGIYYLLDSIQLTGGDTAMFVFPGDGRTWRLEADQHPLHPGNSHPNATVEACGDNANWTSDLVNILPLNDSDPIVDIYCGLVTGSYDPNDKTGYPTGVSTEHYIMPNQQLQYVINFQNTGTDTAFTVVVRDTLDMNLDIFTVVPGVASHDYNFQMYGPRVLEWTFYNILLPDSNHSEAESHGFVTFTVNQNNNLPNNTKIYNSADIYFDFNAPIITNQTMHTIYDGVQTVLFVEPLLSKKASSIKVYPNPTSTEVFVELKKDEHFEKYSLIDMYGREILNGILEEKLTKVSVANLPKGVYLLQISGDQKAAFKVIKD